MKLLILFILILGSIACGVPKQPTTTINFYTYGDSVTAGALNNGISYADYIALQTGWKLTNKAISGTSIGSPNQYPLLMSDSWKYGDIVFFTPGANDSGSAQDSNYTTIYAKELTDVVNKAKLLNVILYIGTPVIPLNETAGWSIGNVSVMAQINRNVVLIADSPNVILIDFNKFYIPTQLTDGDTYHPNYTGYQIMTQIFFNIIN